MGNRRIFQWATESDGLLLQITEQTIIRRRQLWQNIVCFVNEFRPETMVQMCMREQMCCYRQLPLLDILLQTRLFSGRISATINNDSVTFSSQFSYCSLLFIIYSNMLYISCSVQPCLLFLRGMSLKFVY